MYEPLARSEEGTAKKIIIFVLGAISSRKLIPQRPNFCSG